VRVWKKNIHDMLQHIPEKLKKGEDESNRKKRKMTTPTISILQNLDFPTAMNIYKMLSLYWSWKYDRKLERQCHHQS
jgi:hypothetical protein